MSTSKKPSERALLRGSVAVLATAAAFLYGCSPGGDADSVNIEIWARANVISPNLENALEEKFPDLNFTVTGMADIDDKLRSGFRANSGLPDVAVLGGLSNYFTVSERFVDLGDHGFSDDGQYVEWALQAGQDLNGRQIGLPIDIGPFALFYRADSIEALGYPSEPGSLAASLTTFEDYAELTRAAAAQGQFACDSANLVYQMLLLQQGYQYLVNEDGEVVNVIDEEINRSAFETAAGMITGEVCANVEPYTAEWNSAVAQDSVVAFVGPAYQESILKSSVGEGSDVWRVVQPPGGLASNIGSHVVALESSSHPEVAAEIAQFIGSDEMIKDAYRTISLYPPATGLYDDPELAAADPFYGGQEVFPILADVAAQSPITFYGPGLGTIKQAFAKALTDVATLGTNPDEAYRAVVDKHSDYTG